MITAIVCAAGKGTRAGFSQNKLLCDVPLFFVNYKEMRL